MAEKSWSEISEDIRFIVETNREGLEETNFQLFKSILANDITRYVFNRLDVNSVFADRKLYRY